MRTPSTACLSLDKYTFKSFFACLAANQFGLYDATGAALSFHRSPHAGEALNERFWGFPVLAPYFHMAFGWGIGAALVVLGFPRSFQGQLKVLALAPPLGMLWDPVFRGVKVNCNTLRKVADANVALASISNDPNFVALCASRRDATKIIFGCSKLAAAPAIMVLAIVLPFVMIPGGLRRCRSFFRTQTSMLLCHVDSCILLYSFVRTGRSSGQLMEPSSRHQL